ncbi:hypothetical protein NEOKW01_1222 [Nematocida sp. AWRm80]|nr:hypothetical protein NEOKW01_1222 [Nematocida sp. AWRm80]
MPNPLSVLKLSGTPTVSEIKAAYRKRVKETHPDITGKNTFHEFMEVQQAYHALIIERLELAAPRDTPPYLIYSIDTLPDKVECRCGDTFVFRDSKEYSTDCIIDCSSCSNYILICIDGLNDE